MAKNWEKMGERGVSRGTRLDLSLLAMRRNQYPMTRGQIVKDMGLKSSPYMTDIMQQLVRDGYALELEVMKGKRKDLLFSLTPKGEAKADVVAELYADHRPDETPLL